MMIFCMIVAAGFLFMLWNAYNSIIESDNAIQRAWANVTIYEKQKQDILPKLQVVISDYKAYESDLLTKIVTLRNATTELKENTIDTDQFSSVQEKTKLFLSGIKATLENYPELKANQLMQKIMQEISLKQEEIIAAIAVFNGNIEAFNNSIQTFPGNIVNKWINKKNKRIPYLHAESEKLLSDKQHA